MSTTDLIAAAANDLASRINATQLRVPDGAPLIWNAAVQHRPALIMRAESPCDVQEAIRVARDRGMRLSVLGGGHDWAGRAAYDGGLVIDMSGMRSVTVDTEARIATVGGGATAAELIDAVAPYGLVAATGNCGAVGMTGLTLGGGYGPLNGRFGLASDNLVGAEVVLADGRIVTADATHEPELFWALRGGGGNFGVVTSMRVRLHPVDRLIGGMIMFPWSQAATVWRGLRDLLSTAPDALTVQSGLLPGPDGNLTVYLQPAWSGDIRCGLAAVDLLATLGTPLITQVAPVAYGEILRLFDVGCVRGLCWAVRTRTVAGYTPEVIDALVEAARTLTSPRSLVSIHHCHGASTRVAPDQTAFANRRPHFVVEIVACWEAGDGAAHRAWAQALSDALAPHALPGGYANLLGPDDHDQIANAYGDNATRLVAAKNHYDPDAVFTAIPLPSVG
ncbi:FAD-binding oxidoreductase [Mycobacterium sp. IS-1264]|uniref:FAD-binding oxidoreductase n=1 Tax=Mycobacterium sp. IS-1264 TaxID=1834158 RepID=UPI00096DF873|nr:FAD-binding oxidoreductase [Mycobacterium sp. IS-1264]OMC44485.1 FAD-linked oxidase [Mycobacterium sp. IS-1264]